MTKYEIINHDELKEFIQENNIRTLSSHVTQNLDLGVSGINSQILSGFKNDHTDVNTDGYYEIPLYLINEMVQTEQDGVQTGHLSIKKFTAIVKNLEN